MGVRHGTLGSVKENGKKIYHYTIPKEPVEFLDEIAGVV
jgi:hypothetical protein